MWTKFLRWGTLKLILAYQLGISLWIPARCRFYPTCSAYARTCFENYPLGRAVGMTVRRLLRCHPWHPGGIDLPLKGHS